MTRSKIEKMIKDREDESFHIILFSSVFFTLYISPIYIGHKSCELQVYEES